MLIRTCWTAAVAIAVVALASVSSVEARGGAGPNPYAGTYAWNSSPVTISDRGQIEGSGPSPAFYYGTIHGRVADDGSYSFTMTVTIPVFDDPERRTHGPDFRTEHYKFAGTLAPDSSGNLVGTPTTGGSFTWVRQ
jgi:hypothetical protein